MSSAASAGNAAINHIRSWVYGSEGEWMSMGVKCNGEYGVTKGLVYSFPVVIDESGQYKIVEDLEIS